MTGKTYNCLTGIRFNHIDTKSKRCIWVWKCTCGTEILCSVSSVLIGNRKSCGCQRLDKIKTILSTRYRKADGVSCISTLMGRYKREARKANRVWELTRVQFEQLITQPCWYCKSSSSNKQIVGWNEDVLTYTGIDRMDNTKGYLISNVVPCCFICNKAKNSVSSDQFYLWVAAVYNTLKEHRVI